MYEMKDRFVKNSAMSSCLLWILHWYLVMLIICFFVSVLFSPEASTHQKQRRMYESWFYMWDELFLFKQRPTQMVRRCVAEHEALQVLESYHASLFG